jgi:hypothetical protein
MERIEAVIRDALSTRLSLLEPGLQLLSIEKNLPNPQGTREFVDLFARDAKGRYVLIELERSAPASREALHEILKYLEAVKAGTSARDAEVRVFIVSTDWSELLVPSSSFVKQAPCETRGFLLEVDTGHIPTGATPVTPLTLTEDRLFAPWHELNLYQSEASLQQGVRTYEASCAAKGITNFLLLFMLPPPGHHERVVKATEQYLEYLNQSFGQGKSDTPPSLPEYRYLLYFATLRMSKEVCWRAIRASASAEEISELKSAIAGEDRESRLRELHLKLLDLRPTPRRDQFEIGYPAKVGNKLLEDEGWHVSEVKRYGTLKENTLLSDQAIIDDLKGNDGGSPQSYRKRFPPAIRRR